MDGSEARRLRRASGMSQSEFGAAIGVSRETISRFERSIENLDRRTELAMRYVSEGRPERLPDLHEIHDAVAQLLDQSVMRGAPPYDYRDRLNAAFAHWNARQGSPSAAHILHSARGVLGALSMTSSDDRLRDQAIGELRQLNFIWRAARPANSA